MVGSILKGLLVVAGCLILADIVGAIAVTIFDILPLKFASAAADYAIWLVVGAFCGFHAYNIAGAWASPKGEGDWSARPGASAIGTGILVAAVVVVVLAALASYAMFWSQGVAGDDYVPDAMSYSLVFFVAVLGAMGFARFGMMSDQNKPA